MVARIKHKLHTAGSMYVYKLYFSSNKTSSYWFTRHSVSLKHVNNTCSNLIKNLHCISGEGDIVAIVTFRAARICHVISKWLHSTDRVFAKLAKRNADDEFIMSLYDDYDLLIHTLYDVKWNKPATPATRQQEHSWHKFITSDITSKYREDKIHSR